MFILSLEPLLWRIRSNPHIAGVQVSKAPHKVAAFTDDLLFFAGILEILPNLI